MHHNTTLNQKQVIVMERCTLNVPSTGHDIVRVENNRQTGYQLVNGGPRGSDWEGSARRGGGNEPS